MNTWKINKEYRAPKFKNDVPDIYYAVFFLVIALITFINMFISIDRNSQFIPLTEAQQLQFKQQMEGGGK